ncbi:MAG: guanine deaminase [Candidatus Cloacimonetes bacterium]|nr:guanine deaminase [Candidatus Cloacimonadota bacterium]
MKRIVKTNILNPIDKFTTDFRKNIFITIENEKIASIESNNNPKFDFDDLTDCICIPGFIDTHVHLSQLKIRGKHSPNLLHWLNTYTFLEESKSSESNYAKKIAEDFFDELIRRGTTTSVIYVAPFKNATEIAFEVATQKKVRAIIGMTMMDQNSPDCLIQNTISAYEDSIELYEKWDKKTSLLNYIFTPRFAPTCSRELLKKTGDFAQKNKAYIQTHLSENLDEIKWVAELFPECNSYTEVYERYNILSGKTILGHCIHLSENERQIIKKTNSKVAHCPDSNFFLKSGTFKLNDIKESKIDFALASDVGGGTSLSMLNIMKMMNYRQEDYLISPQEAFYYATLGGAKVLGKENIIGSIDIEKCADLAFFKIPDIQKLDEIDVLSYLYYLGSELNTVLVLINGEKV